MRKIFLTSGVILCMVAPAFGAGFSKADVEAGTLNEQTGAVSISAGCVEPKLGVYSGATKLKAIWEAVYNTITLNSNLTEDAGGVEADPSTLFIADGKAYIDTDFAEGTGFAAGQSPFAQNTPLGDSVTYTLKYNLGSGSTQATATTVTPAHRALNGFYYNSKQMIDEDGKLTSDGVGATGAQTWTASWGAGTPTLGANPTRTGYSFVEWNLSPDGEGETAGAITETVDVYAIWSANSFNITYDCDTDNGGHGSQRNATVKFDSVFSWAGNSDATQCGKVGHHFTGWTCTSGNTTFVTNGGVVQHKEGEDEQEHVVPHVFDGASTTASGANWEALANNADILCVAQYAPNGIQITFDYDKAGVSNTEGTCTYGTAIELPETPSKVGYTFGGWQLVTADANEDESLYNGEQ